MGRLKVLVTSRRSASQRLASYLVLGFISVLFMYTFNYGYVAYHELAHEAIFKNAGCHNTEIIINKLTLDGQTFCVDESFIGGSRMEELHSLNEIIGYPIIMMMNVLWTGLCLIAAVILYGVTSQKD